MAAKSRIAACAAWILSTFVTAHAARADESFAFYHENVLGTSMEVRVKAATGDDARRAETRILNEIERLDHVLSSYDASSEFSQLQARPGQRVRASAELRDVLQQCSRWRDASHGAFNPAAEALTRLWSECARQGREPDSGELAKTAQRVQQAGWSVDDADQLAGVAADCPLTLNAIAKGYIIDKAGRAGLDRQQGVSGLLINIGGDLRVFGDMEAWVGIADPWSDSETAEPLRKLAVRGKAVATSGDYQRGFELKGRRHSHIFDPQTGLPADQVCSSTVVADSASDADALATICSILPPEKSIALIEGISGAACLIVKPDRSVVQSSGWRESYSPRVQLVSFSEQPQAPPTAPGGSAPKAASDAATWPADFEMAVSFEINNPNGSRRYCRPYVAMWVEDHDGFPVRTLVLWFWNSGPGPRWLPDLRRWYRSDQMRQLVDNTDLVRTVSRATRPPGKYQAAWDGKDDAGKPVKCGDYTLLIEAAREQGTYQLITRKISLSDRPFVEELQGNVEIKSASVEYRRKTAAKQ